MDYESTKYECDIWQGIVVITCKDTRRCGSIAMTNKKTRQNAGQMLTADVKKYGEEKALATYAKLVTIWEGGHGVTLAHDPNRPWFPK